LLGYNFFPNGNALIVLLLMVPLATLLSVEWNVILSSRVSDVRVAQQIGMLLMLPFAGIYVCGELGIIALGVTRNLLLIAGVLLALDALLFLLARATFRREAILTRWK
jgi:ABC-2 type transport system permease protein